MPKEIKTKPTQTEKSKVIDGLNFQKTAIEKKKVMNTADYVALAQLNKKIKEVEDDS
jgi:hypothetical protein